MKYSFEDFRPRSGYEGLAIRADGKAVLYLSNDTGQSNIVCQPIPDDFTDRWSAPLPVTHFSRRSARRAFWYPNGKSILTLVDERGRENYQIYEVSLQGDLRCLSRCLEARHELGSVPFSPSGRYLVYGANLTEVDKFDIFLHDLSTGESQALLRGTDFIPIGWTPDGKAILMLRYHSSMDRDLFLYDLASGALGHLTPHVGEAKFVPAGWHPQKKGLFILTDVGREFSGLAYLDLTDLSVNWLATPEWDVDSFAMSAGGRYYVWTVNVDGYSHLYVRDGVKKEIQRYEGLPEGVYSSPAFIPGRQQLMIYISTPTSPKTLQVVDIDTGKVQAVTYNTRGRFPSYKMVQPEVVRYPTHDKYSIPALLYKPPMLKEGEQVPVVHAIHGGPELQERPEYVYDGLYQYLLHHGIGILAPNIRGSTGYGKSYQGLIYRKWGKGDLGDFEYAAYYLQALDWVDPNRLGLFGMSYGGFAVLSCVSRLPALWATAVDIMGPSNLVSFVETSPPYWRKLREASIGDPVQDVEYLTESSPLQYASNIEVPLLIIQGAKDSRVRSSESEEMVRTLSELGKRVEYLLFENEGHNFSRVENRIKALNASASWLVRFLANSSGTP